MANLIADSQYLVMVLDQRDMPNAGRDHLLSCNLSQDDLSLGPRFMRVFESIDYDVNHLTDHRLWLDVRVFINDEK